MENLTPFFTLGVALALGLLIGLERGWKDREQEEGQRVAGIRTYALIGLLGGVWGLLSEQLGQALLAAAFVTLALVLVAAHALSQRQERDVGITGVIAGLLTFAFGAMATLGQATLAAAGAVVTTILLGTKPILHAWVGRMEKKELHATLKLLLISVVALPLLPNEGYGPWQALNPQRIWWMVVIIAAISFAGYFAMKIVGERRGILVTGLLAGLASSTAVTVHFSRLARGSPGLENILASGILVACATMFPRILVVSGIFNPSLAWALLWPFLAMTVTSYLAAWIFWRRGGPRHDHASTPLRNPFELVPALIFAGLLTAILLLSRVLSDHFGDAGIYLLAAVSGITDVDPITLSLANMAGDTLGIASAALAILIAAFVNSLAKAGLTLGIGGVQIGSRVGLAMLVILGSGFVTWWLVP
ncbi:MAG: MgtC/SapB family protein [Xanthomonadaceae bacterium]|nr:MgtC/SapB family protein [Xanthomonadaceae bacterium]